MSQPIIDLRKICVDFKQKRRTIHAVNQVSLKVFPGDVYGIVGYSGAGKSTLVRVINRIHDPTSGQVLVNGANVLNLSHRQVRQLRKKIGMIFQHYNLMNARTVLANVEYPLLDNRHLSRNQRRQRAVRLLKLVGLSTKSSFYPSQLSGGQKQRVAIARALANDPKILISDEATSALDPRNTHAILALLKRLNQKYHLTIILITHEMDAVKAICNKVAVMDSGHLIEKGKIFDIFNHPRQQLTRDFIDSTTHLKSAIQQIRAQYANHSAQSQLVELKYVGAATQQPLIIDLYRKFKVTSSILFGNIESIHGKPIGHLIIALNGSNLVKAQQYLKKLDGVSLYKINPER